MDTVTRFFALYFTTLFSLDTIGAARSSPFSINNPQISELIRRGRGGDFGEGNNVGFRLDPGGPGTRKGGFNGGGGPDINVPACKNCPMNAVPTIS
jgi:hypothetical protein